MCTSAPVSRRCIERQLLHPGSSGCVCVGREVHTMRCGWYRGGPGPVPPFATVTAQLPTLTASAVLLVLTSRATSCLLPAGRAAGAHAGATLAAGSWHGCGARACVRCMAAAWLLPGTYRCGFVGLSSTMPACIRASGTAAAHLGHGLGEGTPALPWEGPGLPGGLHRCACGPGCFRVFRKERTVEQKERMELLSEQSQITSDRWRVFALCVPSFAKNMQNDVNFC